MGMVSSFTLLDAGVLYLLLSLFVQVGCHVMIE